ncbi:hypothetical protein [Pseudemcibacter aquimaris]|uniref:hypothetical protein n=1 Tax=Pseudemcibacter aquimaris TaxID=2857064 RepID=UPI0020112D83|nr:hypothetical protein [Pseudemcibacter aquimaris]MCC3862575.1 hypothetical protein [Pseudemcibacter aquimaris]WDU57907.1 hypothetical protein KW060_11960 [Pseudemcibacter aquimaris]
MSLSTGLALVPLLTGSFGLTFEEAVTMAMLHMMLVTSHILIFGEAYAAGWITAALPLVLALVLGGYDSPTERFQMMTALSIEFAVLTFFMGITGFGKKLIGMIPAALKAGIIMGAALSALKRIFYDDVSKFDVMPISFIGAIVLCLVIFYLPAFQKWKQENNIIKLIASLGLLPVFAVVGISGYVAGELEFDIISGVLNPPFASLFEKVSPFAIGWPPLDYYIAAMPIVLMAYVILFGDLLTGKAIIDAGQQERSDDPVDVNFNRSHFAVSIRNFLMAVIVPFFPTQGVLWAGAQVIVTERWKEGKEKLEGLIGGIAAFYYYAIPIGFIWLPVVTFLKPFMPVALMLTLLLTGIACGKLSIGLVKTHKEKAIMMLTALLLTFYDPWIGLSIGALACLLIRTTVKRGV